MTMLFSQDQLFKRDNTKLEVKILEVNPTEIKYKLFSYQDGPLMIVNKSDVALIIYQNGTHEVMSVPTQTGIVNQPMMYDRYTLSNQRRKELSDAKKEKYKTLTTHKNIIGLNVLELMNSGIGLSYLREFNSTFSMYVPVYIGFAQPLLSQSLSSNYNTTNVRNYQITFKNIEAGLGFNFHTSGERPVTHFIGPLITFAQYTGTYDEYNYYNGSYNSPLIINRGFVFNRTSALINNGLLIRINPKFTIMTNVAVGFHNDNYIAGNKNAFTNSFSGLPFNTFKAGLTMGYRF